MKKIAVFGCSYSAGHGTSLYRWINWPTELLLLNNDNFKLYNCALGGSSIDYSVFCLHKFLSVIKPDLVLFQFTTPLRYSWIPLRQQETNFNDFYNILTYKDLNIPTEEISTTKYMDLQNYNIVKIKRDVGWGFITPGSTTSPYSPIKFAKEFYGNVGDNMLDIPKLLSFVFYIKEFLLKNIPCLLLSHDKYSLNSYIDTGFLDLDFKEVLGEEYFEKNVIDEGKHLSHDAIKKIAEIINEKIKGFL